MRRERGLTLVELLIVVGIVFIMLAISVPRLLRALNSVDTAAAEQSLRLIATSEQFHQMKVGAYCPLEMLAAEGLVDDRLAAGARHGYRFQLKVNPDGTGFTCVATPERREKEADHLFVDQTMVVRFSRGCPASVTSLAIDQREIGGAKN